MPRVAWLAGAYALGIAAFDAGAGRDAHACAAGSAGAFAGAVAAAIALCASSRGRARCVARFRLGTLAVAAWFALLGAFHLAVPLCHALQSPWCESETALLEARVASREPQRSGTRWELRDVVRVGSGPRLPASIAFSGADQEALGAVRVGDRIRLRAKLLPLRGERNPGGRDDRDLARRGIGARGWLAAPGWVARLRDPGASSSPRERAARRLERLRTHIARAWQARGAGGGLMAALTVGRRDGISESDALAFRKLGVGHLLAISGLHVALVAGVAYRCTLAASTRLSRAPIDPRTPGLIVAAAAALGYAALAGGGVPVRRALVLFLAIVAAWFAGRPRHGAAALGIAAFVVLTRQPAALFDPGAQLSFAACAALLAAAPAEPTESRALGQRLAAGLRITAVAWAATLPLAAHAFHVVSPWALGANLLLVPWVGAVLLPAALVGSVAALGEGSASDAAVALGAALGEATLRILRWLAAGLGGPWPADPAPSSMALALAAAGWVVRRRGTVGRVAGALGIALFLAVAPPAGQRPGRPRALFLDVGQGDAAIVQSRRAAILVDGGRASPYGGDRGRDTVVPALRALGVHHLDVAIATHADVDHRGGLLAVAGAIPVDEWWFPYGAAGDPAFAPLRDAIRQRGGVIRERGRGSRPTTIEGIRLETLWPPPPADPSARGLSRNDRSLVVRLAVSGWTLLLPGDLEAEGERRLLARTPLLRSDVLKLAHHGSRTSSGRPFLAAVRPDLAVASAAFRGAFAMPHPTVVRRIRAAGGALWWTGRDGAVWIGLGDRLWARGHARRSRCPPRARPQ